MSFKAEVYRVLIASPSDLAEERQVATDAINEWNALHSLAEAVVLLPVKWETHATPRAGVRPQGAINDELVVTCDILVGMFWTKFGTNTGIAESGTVEEIDQFVAASKPAMLYFSRRPVDPNAINIRQQRKLQAFKVATYKKALTGGFGDLDDLRQTLMRDLLNQVRKMKPANVARMDRIERAQKLTELIVAHRQHNISPELFDRYANEILNSRKRSKALTTDPVPPGEVGPNGYRIGYTDEGDKAEWLPDEENPGKEWPMILRRNDKAILEAEEELFDVIWYDRKLVLLQNIEEGTESNTPEIHNGMLAAMRRVEKKYGKRKLRDYYHNDFEWGMLNGKFSALQWVMGSEWDFLDT
jgi:hypothetical protein